MITRFRKSGASHGLKSVSPVIASSSADAAPEIDNYTGSGVESVSPDRRFQMISEAAYFRAERRGFAPGGESRDWLESEAEIEELLAAG